MGGCPTWRIGRVGAMCILPSSQAAKASDFDSDSVRKPNTGSNPVWAAIRNVNQ